MAYEIKWKVRKSYRDSITYKGEKIGEYGVWYPSGRFKSQKFTGFNIRNENNTTIASSSEFFGGINKFLRLVNSSKENITTFLRFMKKGIRLSKTDLVFISNEGL